MHEYESKYPLEILDSFLYPNLLRDSNNRVITENITWFAPTKTQGSNGTLEEIELKIKKSCRDIELAYHDCCGNRWIFLILNGAPSEVNLRRLQKIYKKLYRKMSV